jgi:hypothetical protein
VGGRINGLHGDQATPQAEAQAERPALRPAAQVHAALVGLALVVAQRAAYIQLALRYDDVNNGSLALSARVLELELQCDKATASRALIRLEDVGFIETAKRGTFARRNRKASEYRLTTYKCDVTGELPSKKFMRVPTTIGDLPSLKPWEAEGISERTWYRRRAAAKHGSVAVLTAAPDTCHGCISHCQTANGSPTVAPTQPSRCHCSPDGCTHAPHIESNRI